jgi:arabinofuranosyltransferase
MMARFGIPGEQFPPGTPSASSVDAARRALGCAPLSSYLHAITAPLTFSQAISNIAHAFTYTTMSFSPNPYQAEKQLCG